MEQPRTQELVPGRTGQLRTQELELGGSQRSGGIADNGWAQTRTSGFTGVAGRSRR